MMDKRIKVDVDRCSMYMNPSDYYNTETMKIKFKKLREFRDKVIKRNE